MTNEELATCQTRCSRGQSLGSMIQSAENAIERLTTGGQQIQYIAFQGGLMKSEFRSGRHDLVTLPADCEDDIKTAVLLLMSGRLRKLKEEFAAL